MSIFDFFRRSEDVVVSSESIGEFEKIVRSFVNKLENYDEYDKILSAAIVDRARAWNKLEVFNDMVDKIRVFKDYEETTGKRNVDFPYKPYVDKLLDRNY